MLACLTCRNFTCMEDMYYVQFICNICTLSASIHFSNLIVDLAVPLYICTAMLCVRLEVSWRTASCVH
uniref:Uncharacterized protein n=1 Tax=Triticum urartu TaxID=4572 RepID=A0A8R7QZA1_TRIUA